MLIVACGEEGCAGGPAAVEAPGTRDEAPRSVQGPGDDRSVSRSPSSARAHDEAARELVVAIDARDPRPLVEASRSSDGRIRTIAAVGLARLNDPRLALELVRLLSDPLPEVRAAASMGIGALQDMAPRTAVDALTGALAAEVDPELRGRMVRDLARCGGSAAVPAIEAELEADEADARTGACLALGMLGLRERPAPGLLMVRASARLAHDSHVEVRRACAFALGRHPLPDGEHGAAVRRALRDATRDADAETRILAVRALGRDPTAVLPLLETSTSDADWRVAVQAIRALGRARAAGAIARALERLLDAIVEAHDGIVSEGGQVHVLLEGLEAAAGVPGDPSIRAVVERLHRSLSSSASSSRARSASSSGLNVESAGEAAAPDVESAVRSGQVVRGHPRDMALLHCSAARVLDLANRSVRLVPSCGLGHLETWERRARTAMLAGELGNDDALRSLRRLYEDPDERVRMAVVAAAVKLGAPHADELLLLALADASVAVVGTALEALGERIRGWWQPPRQVASVRPAGAPYEELRPGPPSGRVRSRLADAFERLRQNDELEGLQAWLTAVAAFGGHALARAQDGSEGLIGAASPGRVRGWLGAEIADGLTELARHWNVAVRNRARAVLTEIEIEIPANEPSPIPNPIRPADLLETDVEVTMETTRGAFVVRVDSGLAPTTAARFVALVRSGRYDGVAFHRVVPAFVVQTGDPTGTGYGGPGWSQRCEDAWTEYRRGTVGMALAGRDTGGSQFFVTQAAQPHLEGQYTAFGRVITALDVIDRIQVGDRILRAVVSRETPGHAVRAGEP
ncbi:MAG: peptidylprolyl isomerase [Myxococcota bacterium]|nr:peptidylprolyl isomerase [Myxococcota bacterium]MDW8363414.1 peptidylprolyl isomerase [Myxococcales bacterium]